MQAVTLEQLIALNREISALSAAGVPLAEGLVRVAEEFSGPTSAMATRLAERMEQGNDLSAAIEAEGDALPQSYRALVKAGLQSGQLTAALEGYSEAASRLAELRRVVCLATIYPVILLIAMWSLFLFFNRKILPSFEWLGIQDRTWLLTIRSYLFDFGDQGNIFLLLGVPLVLVAATWLWWRRTARAIEATVSGRSSWLGWIPGINKIRRLSCEANFADLLRLFVEQRVPLSEALPLAAESSGLKSISSDVRDLVSYVEGGNVLGTKTLAFQSLPPLVRLAFASNKGPESLSRGLQRAADSYAARAQSWARNVSLYVPIGATMLIGGTCVCVYALLLLQPYVTTLTEVTTWH